ncbi:hypothetical protein PIROE2DRAFT_14158 [Piromyces sp. E2]|nr:hypothetical protein PIROE2DRAFT_14158 [Piromyces sp. E2]|eukprot:OUM60167.1 hypothetical protein PIROE2DRAFT_14158 [Piromyces sp. E2]
MEKKSKGLYKLYCTGDNSVAGNSNPGSVFKTPANTNDPNNSKIKRLSSTSFVFVRTEKRNIVI